MGAEKKTPPGGGVTTALSDDELDIIRAEGEGMPQPELAQNSSKKVLFEDEQ